MMNNEILPLSVLGITAGLLIAVLAAFRTKKSPSAGVLGRGGIAALFVYAVIAAPVIAYGGMTLFGLLVLVVILGLPVLALVCSARIKAEAGGQAEVIVRGLVGTGLAAVMLIAGGQTIAMLSLVDPRVVVVVIAVVAGLLVAGQGLAASSRVGSIAVWLMVIPILISLALGFLLGSPSKATSPIVMTDGLSMIHVAALALAVIAVGWGDNAVRALRGAGGWSPMVMLGGVIAIVVLIGFGQLMFFGGVTVAPSLQFFTVPANIDLVPGLAAVIFAVLSTLFAALVASAFGGVAALPFPEDRVMPGKWVGPSAVIAVVVALLPVGAEHVLVAASLIGASLLGAQLGSGATSRGIMIGLGVAAAGFVVLAVTGQLGLGFGTIAATAAVVVAAAMAARSGGAGAAAPAEQVGAASN